MWNPYPRNETPEEAQRHNRRAWKILACGTAFNLALLGYLYLSSDAPRTDPATPATAAPTPPLAP